MWAATWTAGCCPFSQMRTLSLAALVAVTQVASAGTSEPPAPVANTAVAPTVEPAPVESVPDEPEEEDEYSEAAQLRKAGIPMPPSQDRKKYLAWRKKLPKKVAAKLDRFCRTSGAGTYYEACNGIGPYAIPKPPSRIAVRRRDAAGKEIGMTVEQWQAGLSPVQNRYYKNYCEGADEDRGFSELCGGTPIVLSFGTGRVEYTAGTGADVPTATTPWLARDLDGDGAVTSDAELFGGATELRSGRLANHGFEPLVELDKNRDGVLDAADPAFGSLLVWTDKNGDRQGTPDELTKLVYSVVSISLDYRREAYCDLRGNCEGERSSMIWRDATGALQTGSAIDVYLRYR
jgi:hypothetical protein